MSSKWSLVQKWNSCESLENCLEQIILRECHNIWLVNSKSEIKINTQNQPGVKSTDHKHQSHILITSLTMKSFFTNQNLDYASNGILCLHILTYFHGHVKGQLSPTDMNVPSWSGNLARYNSTYMIANVRQSVIASLATTPVRWSA